MMMGWQYLILGIFCLITGFVLMILQDALEIFLIGCIAFVIGTLVSALDYIENLKEV